MSRDLAVTVGTAVGLLTILPNAPASDSEKFRLTVRAYMEVLKGKAFEPRHVERAVPELLGSCKFFPTPAEFLQAVRHAYAADPRPSFRPVLLKALPSLPTPLSERPDRDEFLRIRASAHERLGIDEADRQMAGKRHETMDRHELGHLHLTATVPDPEKRKRLEEQRAELLRQQGSKA